MKYLLINSFAGWGSTGRIAESLCRELEAQGHEAVLAYGRDKIRCEGVRTVRIGSAWSVRWHGVQTRLFDTHGFGSKRATRAFLRWADRYDPDVLWLHNLHGYYLNVELLFAWIKSRPQMQVRWTLHDCWAFTGHCPYFSAAGCEQWRTGCTRCPPSQLQAYPKCSGPANVARNYARKRAAFTGVKDMTLWVPSQWLAGLVGQSFLREYPVEVHYNTVDTSVFKPTPSDFRARYGLEDKIVVLGVASTWAPRKGLDAFVELAGLLDERYAIVLVGLSEKQARAMPPRILGIARTDDVRELAAIYTAADVYVNPSVEETFGLTTLEAARCGTRTIVYKDTACEEIAAGFGGVAVEPCAQAICEAILAMR